MTFGGSVCVSVCTMHILLSLQLQLLQLIWEDRDRQFLLMVQGRIKEKIVGNIELTRTNKHTCTYIRYKIYVHSLGNAGWLVFVMKIIYKMIRHFQCAAKKHVSRQTAQSSLHTDMSIPVKSSQAKPS